MATVSTRLESDSMGTIAVPNNQYGGAQTARSLEYFAIGRENMPPEVIHAFGILKKAAALTNMELGKLPSAKAELIIKASEEVIRGELRRTFSFKNLANRQRHAN